MFDIKPAINFAKDCGRELLSPNTLGSVVAAVPAAGLCISKSMDLKTAAAFVASYMACHVMARAIDMSSDMQRLIPEPWKAGTSMVAKFAAPPVALGFIAGAAEYCLTGKVDLADPVLLGGIVGSIHGRVVQGMTERPERVRTETSRAVSPER